MDNTRWNSEWTRADYEQAKAAAPVLRLKCGASIVDYAECELDMSLNLLGNRWISRLSGGFIVAPSGHGKSSLIMQMASYWSCGKPACGIAPARALRIFIAQAEDDKNDIIEMAQMINRMGLSLEQAELVRRNTHVEWLPDCTGKGFFSALRDIFGAEEAPFDLLIINPYTAFQTEDIQDSAAHAEFLRVGLSKLLAEFNLGCLIVHHTPKTNFQNKKLSWFDHMYTMAGAAVLTNWARAVLIVDPTEVPGTYKFIAAKRFEKIGWLEREYWFSHSLEDGRMLWIQADSDQIASASKIPKNDISTQTIIEQVPVLEGISMMHLRKKCEAFTSQRNAKIAIDLAIEDGLLCSEWTKGDGHAGRIKMIFRPSLLE